MLSTIIDMFSYLFIQRAFLAGVFLSIAAALVGVPLVLRQKAMLSDGLSHVSFGAVALAMLLGLAPSEFAIIIAIIAAIAILKLDKKSTLRGDSAIAMIASSALALGMIFVSLNRGSTLDPNSYLFGSIITLTAKDLMFSIVLCAIVIALFSIFYKQIFALSFDAEFAKSIGVKVETYETILAIICSVVVVLGMKISGALLISAFIVFPVLSAMRIVKKFGSVVLCAVLCALIGFILGFFSSYALTLPIGATIAIAELFVYVICCLVARIK